MTDRNFWFKEHTVKTLKDILLERFPNAQLGEHGIPIVCTQELGLATSDICENMKDCAKCWQRKSGRKMSEMADQSGAKEFERLSALQAEAVAEYDALSEDYWCARKLIDVLRVISFAALIVATMIGIANIFFSNIILLGVGIVCFICWIGTTRIADELELSTLRPWRRAMIKYVGGNRTDDD